MNEDKKIKLDSYVFAIDNFKTKYIRQDKLRMEFDRFLRGLDNGVDFYHDETPEFQRGMNELRLLIIRDIKEDSFEELFKGSFEK